MSSSPLSRSYQQQCQLAHALDVLGERWSFLLLRQLCAGPLRFSDLRLALPAMGANLLARRLRQLQEAGVLAQQSQGYMLSAHGESLRPLLRELAGAGAMLGQVVGAGGKVGEGERGRVEPRVRFALLFDSRAARGQKLVARVQVGDEAFCCVVDDGRLRCLPGDVPVPADVMLQASIEAFDQVLAGAMPGADFHLSGSAPALARFRQLFSLPA